MRQFGVEAKISVRSGEFMVFLTARLVVILFTEMEGEAQGKRSQFQSLTKRELFSDSVSFRSFFTTYY
jgi:hypothetical protein